MKQADEGESLDVQRRQIEGYAHMHGLTLAHVLVEGGVSGSVPVEERPVGGALFAKLGRPKGPEEGVMSYSTKLDWRGGPDHGWWVELLKGGERVAYMSLDEWGSLDATQQAIEGAAAKANRAADM